MPVGYRLVWCRVWNEYPFYYFEIMNLQNYRSIWSVHNDLARLSFLNYWRLYCVVLHFYFGKLKKVSSGWFDNFDCGRCGFLKFALWDILFGSIMTISIFLVFNLISTQRLLYVSQYLNNGKNSTYHKRFL